MASEKEALVSTTNEGIHVRLAEGGRIEVVRVAIRFGVDVGSALRFERRSAEVIAEHLLRLHDRGGPPRGDVVIHGDVVTFRVGGTELEPSLILIHRPSAGDSSAVALPWDELPKIARQLVDAYGTSTDDATRQSPAAHPSRHDAGHGSTR